MRSVMAELMEDQGDIGAIVTRDRRVFEFSYQGSQAIQQGDLKLREITHRLFDRRHLRTIRAAFALLDELCGGADERSR